MQVPDVNVLVYAYREDVPDHRLFNSWLREAMSAPGAFGVVDLILSGFLRVVTHPRVFDPPSPVAHAMGFADAVRSAPNAVSLSPGPRHWEIFSDLCTRSRAKGNLIPDAFIAALAIETGSELVTTDRDFARFPGLRLLHPFAE
ncbi:MAG TPA: type II toxin-antitoxin system VapC family toxin [Actinomycetota bacterium]